MTNNILRLLLASTLVFLLLYSSSCIAPQKEEIPTTVELDVTDSLFQRISDWQDLRQSEDLYPILRHKLPTYRYLAARAFASIQSIDAIDSLARLLNDPVVEVRSMAAFAIGQTKAPEGLMPLIRGFVSEDTAMIYAPAQRAILEAVGQCGDEAALLQLSSVTTYSPQDTALLEGQAWGIYRFGLRKIHNYTSAKRMVELCNQSLYPTSVRIIAANYLSRINVPVDTFSQDILTAFERSQDVNIRMALAIALGKTKKREALASLMAQFARERDYRVKCNILRAFSNFPYEKCRTAAVESLRDPNEHVARRAAQYLLDHAGLQDAGQFWRFAKDSLPTPVNLMLYQAANRHMPAYREELIGSINAELRQQYQAEKSPYKKVEALRALTEFPWNYRQIFRESEMATDPIVRTAAAESLLTISEREDFAAFFRGNTRRVTREMGSYFMSIIRKGEAGPMAIAAQALRSKTHNYLTVDSIAPLAAALEKLELPAMVETYNALAQTISELKGESTFEPLTPKYNHPIDWQILEENGNRPRLELTTNKGTVSLQLWARIAPGSVANLLALAKSGFLDGKVFHRVVPNFVIQGGSPSNDAYGSLDYSIRSEFSDQHYDEEGLLGMASAGADTEGTQFFITHSPTLHLDGNYTVFGQVIKGMDVVHQIQMGDRITSAVIIPTK